MDTSSSFGRYLREVRIAHARSMSDTARGIGVTPQYYSDVERDRRGVLAADKLLSVVQFLCLDEKERTRLYDLAAEGRKRKDVAVPQDFAPYIRENHYVAEALRVARDSEASEAEWQKFIDDLKRRKGRMA